MLKKETYEAFKIAKDEKEWNTRRFQSVQNKIAHTPKIIIKREKVMNQGVPKILGLGKYPTHLHILIRVYDSYLLASSFWLSNICDVSMPLIHTYLKLHSKPFRDRMKRRQSNALVRIIHIERSSESFEELTFYFAKLIKPLDRRLIKEWMIGNSVKTVLSCNHLRLRKTISPTGIKLKGWIEYQTYLNWGRILCYRHGTCELYSAL